ncbi:T9SS type A sorting domain-containing protein [Flagellimonas iocasae]|uniref:T9SS type A sorting domain-containing protein n=1 Tax=Flagellimonas iocasae TaxID=2055905 RepID=A0ABW4XUV6_9FLAO
MKKITLTLTFIVCNLALGGLKPTTKTDNYLVDVIIAEDALDLGMFQDTDYQVPTRLIFPNLVSVEGSLDIRGNSNLMVIEAPLLKYVGDNFVIEENPDLLEIILPKLNNVGANLVFVENPQLERIDISKFEQSFGDVHIYANPNMTSMDLSRLEKVCGGIAFHLNHALTAIDLPELKSIGHYCGPHIGSFFHVFNNDHLQSVTAPKLAKVDFAIITNNSQLKKLNLCNIVVDEEFDVQNNHVNINVGPPYCPENLEDGDNNEEIEEDLAAEEENLPDDEVVIEDGRNEENEAEIYPIPSDDTIRIAVESPVELISIYDMSGNLVKTFRSEEEQYDISGIAPGIYVVTIFYSNGSISPSRKIIIR